MRIVMHMPELQHQLDLKKCAHACGREGVKIMRKRIYQSKQTPGDPIPQPTRRLGPPALDTLGFVNSIRHVVSRNGAKVTVAPRGERSRGIVQGFLKRGVVLIGFTAEEVKKVADEGLRREIERQKKSGEYRLSTGVVVTVRT